MSLLKYSGTGDRMDRNLAVKEALRIIRAEARERVAMDFSEDANNEDSINRIMEYADQIEEALKTKDA